MRGSIRWRLSLYQVIVVSLAMVVVAVSTESSLRRYYCLRLENHLTQQALLIRRMLVTEMGEGGKRPRLQTAVRALGAEQVARITVTDTHGVVLADTSSPGPGRPNVRPQPEVAAILRARNPAPQRHALAMRADGMHVAVPLTRYGKLVGVVCVGLSLSDLEEQMRGLRMIILGTILFATIAAVATTLYVARSITEPISEVTDAARRMAGGDLTRRVISSPDDEVGQLTRSFNTMAARIQEMLDELERERQKMAHVFTQMTDGLVVVDGECRVVLINPAARRMLGAHDQEAVAKPFDEVAAFPELAELAHTVLETHSEQEVEIMRERPEELVINVHGDVVAERPGVVPGAMFVLQDWTDVWRTERLRREFVANASHELRTPIASVKMMAETLLEGAQDDPKVRMRFIRLMAREANRLSALASDLLDLSQLEAGQWPLEIQPVRLREVADQVLGKLVPKAREHQQSLSGKCHPELMVLADRRAVGQILTNLVENAIKYTPDGGKIQVLADAEEERIRIRVSDTGIGIPAEDLNHIFERFYRVDKARSREQGGSGLGLAIVRHLVDALSGTIHIESQLGEGTTFTVTLPAASGQ